MHICMAAARPNGHRNTFGNMVSSPAVAMAGTMGMPWDKAVTATPKAASECRSRPTTPWTPAFV